MRRRLESADVKPLTEAIGFALVWGLIDFVCVSAEARGR